jgi:SAM-dependent methyltransferase
MIRESGNLAGPGTTPNDPVGAETLEIMNQAPRYNAWQYARIAPYLGRRLCEIGAGVGNMSSFLVGDGRALAVLAERDELYLESLRRRFGVQPQVVVERLALPDATAGERFARFQLDTVVALNVIEHVPDDVGALRTAGDLLQPGGRLVVLVPACQAIFGTLDEALGHVQRYSRTSIEGRMRQAGLEVERSFYFNLAGIPGWWFNSRIRRSRLIPLRQLRLFDAMVPVLRLEDHLPLPIGQSVVCVARRPAR